MMSVELVSVMNALNEKGIHVIADRAFDKIVFDFTEHDKKVTAEKDAKIAELKTRNEKLEKENKELRERLNFIRQRCTTDAIEYWNDGHIGSLVVTLPKYLTSDKRFEELEDRHQSDCIRINQLLTTIDVLTERYQKLREVHGL